MSTHVFMENTEAILMITHMLYGEKKISFNYHKIPTLSTSLWKLDAMKLCFIG